MNENKCNCRELKLFPWSNKNVYCIVTGAGKGFGKSLCISLVKFMASSLSFNCLIFGRNFEKTNETKDEMYKEAEKYKEVNIRVYYGESCQVDLSSDININFVKCLEMFNLKSEISLENSFCLLMNNAASVGELSNNSVAKYNRSTWESYIRLNFLSMIDLTSVFMNFFRKSSNVCIVNVSSLCGIVPFAGMSQYCSIKSAREMFLKCLAVDNPNVAVMNYSPGPLLTDMFHSIRLTHENDNMRKVFEELHVDKKALEANVSANMLLSWLRKLSFDQETGLPKSNVCEVHEKNYIDLFKGTHLDYFDALEMDKSASELQ